MWASRVIEVTETKERQFVSFLLKGIRDFTAVPIEENVNHPSEDTGDGSE
jgi:hypothetical protein